MDPYSAEGELINIHNAFHSGQYQTVIDFDTSSFSASNTLPSRILTLRARLALGDASGVLKEVQGEAKSSPDLAAVKVLAESLLGKDVLEEARKLAKEQGQENLSVQLLVGTVLARVGEYEEALGLLGLHQGSLDAVALIVQIHLLQNRTDLAMKEAQRARKWAQDSLLVNLAESWVGMREGGEKYQSAYYVFEELAQAPATQATHSLISQAVSELHLHRFPESQAAFEQAVALDAESADTLANLIVLNTVQGNDTKELVEKLRKVDPRHGFLVELEAKREEFERARGKYTPKFEV